jgi:hypothetical protein
MLLLSHFQSFCTAYKDEHSEDNSDPEWWLNCCTGQCWGRFGGKMKRQRKDLSLDLEVSDITIHEKATRYTNKCGCTECNNSDTEPFYHCQMSIWISIGCSQLMRSAVLEGGGVLSYVNSTLQENYTISLIMAIFVSCVRPWLHAYTLSTRWMT